MNRTILTTSILLLTTGLLNANPLTDYVCYDYKKELNLSGE